MGFSSLPYSLIGPLLGQIGRNWWKIDPINPYTFFVPWEILYMRDPLLLGCMHQENRAVRVTSARTSNWMDPLFCLPGPLPTGNVVGDPDGARCGDVRWLIAHLKGLVPRIPTVPHIMGSFCTSPELFGPHWVPLLKTGYPATKLFVR